MMKEQDDEIQIAVDASVKTQALSFQAQLKHAPMSVPEALFATCGLSLRTGVVCHDDSETESEEDEEEEDEEEERRRRKEAKAARHSLLDTAEPAPKRARTRQGTQQQTPSIADPRFTPAFLEALETTDPTMEDGPSHGSLFGTIKRL